MLLHCYCSLIDSHHPKANLPAVIGVDGAVWTTPLATPASVGRLECLTQVENNIPQPNHQINWSTTQLKCRRQGGVIPRDLGTEGGITSTKLKMNLRLLFLQSHRLEGAVGKYQAGGLNGTFPSNQRFSPDRPLNP